MQFEVADRRPGQGMDALQAIPGPDRRREVRVVKESRNHMPVQMGDKIAETGKVHLFGRIEPPQGNLGCKNQVHEMVSIGANEIAHFANVVTPDDPAESRMVETFLSADPDYPATPVLPENVAPRSLA